MSLKQGILYDLETNRDKDISGQALAEKYGVSRNAVWKAINSLKSAGYVIESTTNRGYRLSDCCDIISESGIAGFLSQKNKGLKIFSYDSVDSTNEEAKRLLVGGLRGDFIVASKTQTNGKGRFGKTFFSPNEGAYMSLVIHPEENIHNLLSLTSAVAVAVAKAIEETAGKFPKIKWVNDILLDGNKVAGILTEAVTGFEEGLVTSVIIGVGINIKPCKFPKELEGHVGFIDPDKPIKNEIIAIICDNILEYSENLADKSFFEEYKKRSLIYQKNITFEQDGKMLKAFVYDIDNKGFLKIRFTDGTTSVIKNSQLKITL